MKIIVTYLHVLAKSQPACNTPDYYLPFTKRFVKTYTAFKPSIEHELRIVFCGATPTSDDIALYDSVRFVPDTYLGPGWDLGAHQEISRKLECDLVL
jgi:hypothetical protein